MNDILIKTKDGFTREEAERVARKADEQCVREFWLPAQICADENGKFTVRIQRRKRAW
ncbi:MAG: hypothetical protein IKG14_05305 [Clostridia bacterium]|nr:hypothetical protein [Clostridia bacterium]